MTKDELKEKLKSAWIMKKQLESDYDELQRLRDNANKITPAYSLAPGGSGSGQKLEDNIVKIADMKAMIQNDMAQLLKSLREVKELIRLVDDPRQRLVLQMRYLNCKKWEQIAADLGYAWQHIHRLHSKALNSILSKL